MKVIDLLNKIANDEEVPKRIKYKCDIYVIGEDACNKDIKYINEKKDVDGYTRYLFQDWILDVILNDEVEIIEEDKFETIDKWNENIIRDLRNDEEVSNWQIKNYISVLMGTQNQIIDELNKLKGGKNDC